ncbi:MFS general substrate transporter [Gyrodon lividus]|nr:MFS general substrate transporter [Gyrodon lividus]
MSLDDEKRSESLSENVVGVQPVPDDFVFLTEGNRKAGELMPTVVVIYLMNYIDRVAITAARLKGLETDLHLTDVQYDTLLAVLYASYCPAQIPSNMDIRPSFYIGACVIAWGLTSALTGVTKNFAGIMACRLFIGLPEVYKFSTIHLHLTHFFFKIGGLLPGIGVPFVEVELALRSAVFYVGLLISNAFGSWIAAGILGNMQGKLGITAWRCQLGKWLLTSVSCQPHNTRWLSPAERRLAQVRLAEDAGEADQDSSDTTIFDGFKLAIRDPKVWIFMIMGCSQLLGLSYINFFPTPPWVFASICCVINAWNCGKNRQSDRTGERFLHIASWWWAVIVGYTISLATMSTGGRYFSLFLMTTGYCGYALTLMWVSNSIPRPPAKRSVAIGLVNGFGNLGNLMGSYIWKASWSPEYHQSMIIALCSLVLTTFLGLIIRQILIRENKQMDRLFLKLIQGPERERIEEAARLEGITFEEAMRRRKGFRYLY